MTNQPSSPSGSFAGSDDDKRASQYTSPLRQLGAYALLTLNGLLLVLGFFRLLIADQWADTFGARSVLLYRDFFAGMVAVFFPLLAVLLANHIRPVVAQSRLITMVALIEYAVSAGLGLITFIGAFSQDIDDGEARPIFENLLIRAAWAGLLVLAGLAVYRVWRGLYWVPKPAAPQYYSGYPQGYGSYHPGHAQPGHPGQGQPGQPGHVPAGYPTQGQYPPPGFGQPGQPAQHQTQPTYPPPPSYPPPGQPQQPSYPGQGGWPTVPPPPAPNPPRPTSAPPVSSTPPGQVPPDAPTQQIR